MAEKRGIQNSDIWPDSALIERLQETSGEILRRWSPMMDCEARSFGLDPLEVRDDCLKALIESVMAWTPTGGRKPDRFARNLIRLRLINARERINRTPLTISIEETVICRSERLTLGDTLEDRDEPGRFLDGDPEEREQLELPL
jgi:hypothetical protein